MLASAPPAGTGYDGNNESEHYSAAQFLVQDMMRYSEFTGRDFNSHGPTLDRDRRMKLIFDRVTEKTWRPMSVEQLIEVLQA